MKLTPRKDEINAVIAVLEDPGHKDAQAMARAVIKTVAEALSQREWWLYAWRDGPGPVLAWGPFASEKDTEVFAGKVALKGEHRAIPVYSPYALMERMDKQDKGIQRYCTTCNHPLGTHQHDRRGGRCAVRGCDCKQIAK